MVTSAPGITAPLVSLSVPMIVPVNDCPNRVEGTETRTRHNNARIRRMAVLRLGAIILASAGWRGYSARSRSPERVHERAVAGDVPDRHARPCPAARLDTPLEGPVAKVASVGQVDNLAMRRLAVAPYDLGEPQRERPLYAGRCRDLGGRG